MESLIRILALATLLLAPTVRAGEFAPNPSKKGAPPFRDGRFEIDRDDFLLQLTLLGGAQRRAWLETHAGTGIDPFAVPPERGEGFVTAELAVRNRGKGTLVIQSQECLLAIRRSDERRPLDLPSLHEAYRFAGNELPAAYGPALRALLDGEIDLAPGGSVRGLLVYRAPSPGTRSFRLRIPLTTPAGERVIVEAPYRRAKRDRSRGSP